MLDGLDRGAIASRLRSGWVSRLHAQELPRVAYREPRPAAVLVPMFRHWKAWHLLFIRRTEYPGDYHSGEVAFPGGRQELGDTDATATALREAQEEIGLDPERVIVLGELQPLHTASDYLITPVVGEIPWPLALRPDLSEVARVFGIPLAWLGDAANRRILTWPAPNHPEAREVFFYERFNQELLWGVSARITVDFLDVLASSDRPENG